ncbi:uncharacterized protein LOC119613600 [Lucilia sericata]|uniref:uncharacterized protein LOC119613600 n=1 Tax=Lucilia sericata TaxID=13632 RepID=UPI0018A80FE7|nr:uncharacterized protein LOC119613600 [Lucilia sericata]
MCLLSHNRKKIKITNGKQFETLMSELEKNPCLAKGFSRGTNPTNFKNDWEQIAVKLNSIGPPIRDSDGWQKVWRDFKCKVKKKLAQNKAEVNATGGGTFKQFSLSPLEEAAANLMQFQKQLNPEGEVHGIQNTCEEIENLVENTLG